MRKQYETLKNLQIQKGIVSVETIHGNTVNMLNNPFLTTIHISKVYRNNFRFIYYLTNVKAHVLSVQKFKMELLSKKIVYRISLNNVRQMLKCKNLNNVPCLCTY